MVAAYLFGRRPALYPGGDPVGYARELGMAGIALEGIYREQRALIPRAVEAFGRENVLIWDGPGQWRPSTWRETAARDVALCAEHGLGLVPDPEHSREWESAGREEVDDFGETVLVNPTRLGIPVWMYTFHGHFAWRRWAEICAEHGAPVRGALSLYGHAHGVPRANYGAVAAEWDRRWPGGLGPAISLPKEGAGWPGIPVDGYGQYLADVFRVLPRPSSPVLVFHGNVPRPGDAYYETFKAWLRLGGDDGPRPREPSDSDLLAFGRASWDWWSRWLRGGVI